MEDSYVIDSNSIEHDRLLQALKDVDKSAATKKEEKWFNLIRKLPSNLRSALLLELESGNRVTSIQYCNWPQKGSILISLAFPFKNDFSGKRFGVDYRLMNDPHYWQTDIHQIVDGVEHLIVT